MAKIAEDRRKKYLVNKRLQLQLSYLLLIQLIPIIILTIFIYVLNEMYLSTLQNIVGATIISVSDIQNILNFFMLTMAVFVVVAGVLLTFMGIRFSHHIAGPLYRLEENMLKLARGERIEPIRFRKTDAINVTSIVDAFNALVDRLNKVAG